MHEFYSSYYAAVEHSAAHHVFCERVFDIDLCQHGFADRAQLDLLLDVTELHEGQHALDLGCGNGRITEYLSDRSGARITGLDYIPHAIHSAQQRTAAKADRLAFMTGDINALDLPPGDFDLVISIDTMYFSTDYAATIGALKASLRPGGRMAFLFSHGWEPWVPKETFPKDTLPPECTPLAVSLAANGLTFRARDLTQADYALAVRRKAVLADLKAQFEVEGLGFIYENRAGDAGGIMQAIEAGLHARYLYLTDPS